MQWQTTCGHSLASSTTTRTPQIRTVEDTDDLSLPSRGDGGEADAASRERRHNGHSSAGRCFQLPFGIRVERAGCRVKPTLAHASAVGIEIDFYRAKPCAVAVEHAFHRSLISSVC